MMCPDLTYIKTYQLFCFVGFCFVCLFYSLYLYISRGCRKTLTLCRNIKIRKKLSNAMANVGIISKETQRIILG